MLNNVVLVGRFEFQRCRIEIYPVNVAVATFTLAVKTVHLRVKMANVRLILSMSLCGANRLKTLLNWAKKGSLIGVTGRIQTQLR